MTAAGALAAWLLAPLLLGAGTAAPADEPAEAKPLYWYLTLDDAIRIALRNNRNLLDARLGRDLDEHSLALAEDRYRPRADLGASSGAARNEDPATDLSAETSLRIPTGGRITLRWSKPVDGGPDASDTYTLRFSQPLLRGRGAVDTAPLRRARLDEEGRVLAFRGTIAGVVDLTILAWRGLTRAARELEIEEAALRRAQRQLQVNRALIRAGDMAAREILQSEADIANRELALAQARNRLTAANFALIDILDMESSVRVRPLEAEAEAEAEERAVPEVEKAIATALHNRPGYRRVLLEVQAAKIGREVAENERLWDLSVQVDATRRSGGGADPTDYGARLNLAIPLFDRGPRVSAMRARGDVLRAERALEEHRQQIGIEVRQAVQDVEVGRRRRELARLARELTEQKLEIERTKLREGLSSSFRLTRFEEDLVRTQNAEVDAQIGYENALTALDRTLGTTLERWNIRVEQVGR